VGFTGWIRQDEDAAGFVTERGRSPTGNRKRESGSGACVGEGSVLCRPRPTVGWRSAYFCNGSRGSRSMRRAFAGAEPGLGRGTTRGLSLTTLMTPFRSAVRAPRLTGAPSRRCSPVTARSRPAAPSWAYWRWRLVAELAAVRDAELDAGRLLDLEGLCRRFAPDPSVVTEITLAR
jgi:hypothetical protein